MSGVNIDNNTDLDQLTITIPSVGGQELERHGLVFPVKSQGEVGQINIPQYDRNTRLKASTGLTLGREVGGQQEDSEEWPIYVDPTQTVTDILNALIETEEGDTDKLSFRDFHNTILKIQEIETFTGKTITFNIKLPNGFNFEYSGGAFMLVDESEDQAQNKAFANILFSTNAVMQVNSAVDDWVRVPPMLENYVNNNLFEADQQTPIKLGFSISQAGITIHHRYGSQNVLTVPIHNTDLRDFFIQNDNKYYPVGITIDIKDQSATTFTYQLDEDGEPILLLQSQEIITSTIETLFSTSNLGLIGNTNITIDYLAGLLRHDHLHINDNPVHAEALLEYLKQYPIKDNQVRLELTSQLGERYLIIFGGDEIEVLQINNNEETYPLNSLTGLLIDLQKTTVTRSISNEMKPFVNNLLDAETRDTVQYMQFVLGPSGDLDQIVFLDAEQNIVDSIDRNAAHLKLMEYNITNTLELVQNNPQSMIGVFNSKRPRAHLSTRETFFGENLGTLTRMIREEVGSAEVFLNLYRNLDRNRDDQTIRIEVGENGEAIFIEGGRPMNPLEEGVFTFENIEVYFSDKTSETWGNIERMIGYSISSLDSIKIVTSPEGYLQSIEVLSEEATVVKMKWAEDTGVYWEISPDTELIELSPAEQFGIEYTEESSDGDKDVRNEVREKRIVITNEGMTTQIFKLGAIKTKNNNPIRSGKYRRINRLQIQGPNGQIINFHESFAYTSSDR